jgi:hypothetical protein
MFIKQRPFVLSLAACAAIGAAPTASAADAESHGSVSVTVSPLGLSLGLLHYSVSDDVSVRLGLSTGGLVTEKRKDVELEGNRYDLRQRAGPGLSLLADYHPWHDTGWRLTGGLVVARFKTTLTGRADGAGNYAINDRSYSTAQVGTLGGTMKSKPVNLYLGGGWESRPAGAAGWRFVSDLGLLVMGKSRTTLTASAGSGNAALQQDLAAEGRQLNRPGLGLLGSVGVAHGF